MPNITSLKDYLVKIGWDIDELGFNSVTNKLGIFDNVVAKLSASTAFSYVKAGATIVGVLGGIVAATAKLVDKTATVDLQTERLARRLWTTEENARSLSVALDSLDMSYDDLFYATEEQYNQFLKLNALGKTLEAPAALDETLKDVREIQYEFSRLETILSYGTRWVVYYLGQMFGMDIESFHGSLKDLNDWLIENIDRIASKIAKFLGTIYKLFKTGYQVVKALLDVLASLADSFGIDVPKSIAVLSAAFLAFAAGPVGKILLALGALLLLIEDYMVWSKGGDALFDWSKPQQVIEKLNDAFSNTSGWLKDIYNKSKDLFDVISGRQSLMDAVMLFVSSLETGLNAINTLISLIIESFKSLTGETILFSESETFKNMNKFFESGLNFLDAFYSLMLGPLYGDFIPTFDSNSSISGTSSSAATSYSGTLAARMNSARRQITNTYGDINVEVNATTNDDVETVTYKAVSGTLRGRYYVQNN